MKFVVSWIKFFAMLILVSWWNLPAISQETITTVTFTDTDGNSISDIEAWYSTDKIGRRAEVVDGEAQLFDAKGIVVARAKDFQYSGAIIDSKENVEVVMRRSDEAGRRLKTLPVPITDSQRKQLIDGMIHKCWSSFEANYNDISIASQSGKRAASLVPERCLEFIKTKEDISQPTKTMMQLELMEAFAKKNVQTIVELLEPIDDPMMRASCLGRALLFIDQEEKLLPAIENELVSVSKAIKQPAFRLATLAMLAEHYQRTGRDGIAQKIIDEHLEEARKLPSGGWPAYPKSLFAALIVADIPDVALQMIEGNDGGHEGDRAIGRLAFHCCQKNPELAVELLAKIDAPANTINKFNRHIKVCGEMASNQSEAAFELAESIAEPNQQAWAFGFIAQRLESSDPTKAIKALELAVSAIDSKTKSATGNSKATTLAGLLPVAEKMAPEKLESMIWKTAYYSIPKSRWIDAGQRPMAIIQNAAAGIARYDREIALALIRGSQLTLEDFEPYRSAVNAMVLRPEKINELTDQWEKDRPSVAYRSQDAVVKMLQGTDEIFWANVSKPTFMPLFSDRYEDH